jgi:hypothetical protein
MLDALVGGAVVLIRDVAREHLRREKAPSWIVSLQAPIPGVPQVTLTLEDLLPGTVDPAEEAAVREFERLSRVHAHAFFQAMERRERVALLAKELGLSLASPLVEEVAGCRKSALNDAYFTFFKRVAADLKTQYAEDDENSLRILAEMTFRGINDMVWEWGASERSCADFFSRVVAR